MLAAVDFVSLATFEELHAAPDMAAISIGDPDDEAPSSLTYFSQRLRLQFLDSEPEDRPLNGFGLFTPYDAGLIVSFVSRLHRQETPTRLVVHCRMGASRSASVALAVHALTGCAFPRQQDACYANRHVAHPLGAATGNSIAVPGFFDQEPHEWLPTTLLI